MSSIWIVRGLGYAYFNGSALIFPAGQPTLSLENWESPEYSGRVVEYLGTSLSVLLVVLGST